MAIKAKSSFSLKDQLFNEQTLRMLTDGLCPAWPEFEREELERKVLGPFPALEDPLDRLGRSMTLLPAAFDDALEILREALPPPLDPTRSDGNALGLSGRVIRVVVYTLVPRAQRLKVGLKICFQEANGSLCPKAFAIKNLDMKAGEEVKIVKRQPFKPSLCGTHPGAHRAELVVNGTVKATPDSVLADPH